MASPTLVIPGQLLGPASKYQPGPGTHLHESNLYSSLLGTVTITPPISPSSSSSFSSTATFRARAPQPGPVKRLTKITPAPTPPPPAAAGPALGELPTISVAPRGRTAAAAAAAAAAGAGGSSKREVLPEVGNTVLCRVVRVTPRQAVVAMLVCGETVLEAEWQGVIRVQDVRATEKDRVRIGESFRPGDVVRAEVISLGDQANYYLSTARNELGVILATSEAGNTMYPVSWKEYRDPETGMTELRKVARPY